MKVCKGSETCFCYGRRKTKGGFEMRLILIFIYLTAIGLTPGGSITRYIYKQTIHKIHSEGKLGFIKGVCYVLTNCKYLTLARVSWSKAMLSLI